MIRLLSVEPFRFSRRAVITDPHPPMVSVRSMPFPIFNSWSACRRIIYSSLASEPPKGMMLAGSYRRIRRAGIELRSQQWPGKSRQRECTALNLKDAPSSPHLTRIAIQGGAAPELSLAMRKQSLAARLDRLGPARETAQIGAVRIRPVFSHSLWKRNREEPVAASRSHTDGGKPRRPDHEALPSVAVAAAARRSTLPSGPRGTASTAHSHSGVL
jgi:hypothetical protein